MRSGSIELCLLGTLRLFAAKIDLQVWTRRTGGVNFGSGDCVLVSSRLKSLVFGVADPHQGG